MHRSSGRSAIWQQRGNLGRYHAHGDENYMIRDWIVSKAMGGENICSCPKLNQTRPKLNSDYSDGLLATFRRKIGALGRVVKGAQQRKTRRERPAGVLQSLMVRAGGFTGQPAFPMRGRC